MHRMNVGVKNIFLFTILHLFIVRKHKHSA